jgi:hypothetical protein
MSKIKVINLRKNGLIYSGFAQCGPGCRYHFIAKPNGDVSRVYRQETLPGGRETWKNVATPRALSKAIRKAMRKTTSL